MRNLKLLLLCFGLAPWPAHAARFVPVPSGVADLALDSTGLLRFDVELGDAVGPHLFEVASPQGFSPKDKVTWTIDGKTPKPGCADTGRQDYNKSYMLALSARALGCYSPGPHAIAVQAALSDSTVQATWHVRLLDIVYGAAEVDFTPARSANNRYGYHIDAARPIDRALFDLRSEDFAFAADLAGSTFRDSALVRSPWMPLYQKPDSLIRGVFLARVSVGDKPARYLFSRPKSDYLAESAPPFPIKDALAVAARLAVAIRLGPVWGEDLYVSISAHNDHKFWYFTKWEGFGDCPAGCTESRTTEYRVLKDSIGEGLCTTVVNSQFPNYHPTTCEGHSDAIVRPSRVGRARRDGNACDALGRAPGLGIPWGAAFFRAETKR